MKASRWWFDCCKEANGHREIRKYLDADADKLLSKACKTDDLQEMKKFVTEANSLKTFSKEMEKLVGEYETTVQNMQMKIIIEKKMRSNRAITNCWKCSIYDHIHWFLLQKWGPWDI